MGYFIALTVIPGSIVLIIGSILLFLLRRVPGKFGESFQGSSGVIKLFLFAPVIITALLFVFALVLQGVSKI